MTKTSGQVREGVRWIQPVFVHSARTAVVAVASFLTARLLRLPEAYWAPITTLVITQSSLGAALPGSWQRFVGTVLGAVVGAIVASHFGPQALAFGAGVFILGLLCALAHLDRTAYRFGGVTLAIVLLVPRTGPAWQIAFHRFAGVSTGIGVALMLAMVWPERITGRFEGTRDSMAWSRTSPPAGSGTRGDRARQTKP